MIYFFFKIFTEKPERPSAPESLETADDSITIMWKPPTFDGGSQIINYIVEYQEKTSEKYLIAYHFIQISLF